MVGGGRESWTAPDWLPTHFYALSCFLFLYSCTHYPIPSACATAGASTAHIASIESICAPFSYALLLAACPS